MDNDEFKLNETGISTVDTAGENIDVYYTKAKFRKQQRQAVQ